MEPWVTGEPSPAVPIPKVHKQVIMKEIQQICDLGVTRVATLIGVGNAIIHSTKEEQDCTLFNRFLGSKQKVS